VLSWTPPRRADPPAVQADDGTPSGPPPGSLGWSVAGCSRHRAIEFRKFLIRIEDEVPKSLDVHVVLDNYATHRTPAIQRWLARHPRFHLHFTPTGASRLNLVERWFAELTQKQLRLGVHRSPRELEKAIQEFLEVSNEDPRPFPCQAGGAASAPMVGLWWEPPRRASRSAGASRSRTSRV
jgi:transposase